jgi:hypothetical protein
LKVLFSFNQNWRKAALKFTTIKEIYSYVK